MDFSFTEEQEAVRELAARIFSDLATNERLKEIESTEILVAQPAEAAKPTE